jgi:hypothetical protein
MKDWGSLKYFFGIEVSQAHKRIFLPKIKYVLDLLQKTCMPTYWLIDTFIKESLKLYVESNQISYDEKRCQGFIGDWYI